jgi:hypothetical protein
VLYHVSLYNPRRPAPVTGNLGCRQATESLGHGRY